MIGRILAGAEDEIRRAHERFQSQPVNMTMFAGGDRVAHPHTRTIGSGVSVEGPGTFFGGATRTLALEPTDKPGWWFDRTDLPEALPIHVSVDNVWTTARNIVLRSGSPHNYMRMVEHIIALKEGMCLDNLLIKMDSGDPPLFKHGSMDLVEAIDRVGIVDTTTPARYVGVTEPVTVGGPNGSFLTFLPPEDAQKQLLIDCAIDFKTAIGKQRIQFEIADASLRHGAQARTNTTFAKMIFCRTIGKLFADVRNLGYTTQNILVAGRFGYINKPKMIHNGVSLEAAWHRAVMDLVAAVGLIDRGRFAGKIISYRAGHALDVVMIRNLLRRDLLAEF